MIGVPSPFSMYENLPSFFTSTVIGFYQKVFLSYKGNIFISIYVQESENIFYSLFLLLTQIVIY